MLLRLPTYTLFVNVRYLHAKTLPNWYQLGVNKPAQPMCHYSLLYVLYKERITILCTGQEIVACIIVILFCIVGNMQY